MMHLSSYIITGWIVLIAAILLNLLADRLGITGWYGFLTGMAREGLKIWSQIGWLDIIWLFILYPMALGIAAHAGLTLSNMFLQK
jgi:hypothetical protein